jgi:hypothetical protein
MGQRIGIPLGNGIKQQQLQSLDLIELIQALLPEPVF